MRTKRSIFDTIADLRKSESINVHLDNMDMDCLKDLVAYLRNSHKHYIEYSIPHLHEAIHAMLTDCDTQVSAAMNSFFDDYEKHLQQHFRYEEKHLFPYADSLIAGKDVDFTRIPEHNSNHSGMENSLHDMETLIINHINSTDKVTVLFYLFRLEDEIHKHVILEERVLVPLINKLVSADE